MVKRAQGVADNNFLMQIQSRPKVVVNQSYTGGLHQSEERRSNDFGNFQIPAGIEGFRVDPMIGFQSDPEEAECLV
jgi:hypothetical protein